VPCVPFVCSVGRRTTCSWTNNEDAVVADFGLATEVQDSTSTGTSSVQGTLGHIAPGGCARGGPWWPPSDHPASPCLLSLPASPGAVQEEKKKKRREAVLPPLVGAALVCISHSLQSEYSTVYLVEGTSEQ